MESKHIIFLIAIIFISACQNPSEPGFAFVGTWDTSFKGDFDFTKSISINDKGEFGWTQSFRFSSSQTATLWIKGNVSNNGSMLGITAISGVTNSDIGTFSGNLSDKNGSGTWDFSYAGKSYKHTWTAFKQ